jgi:hypothetical protein
LTFHKAGGSATDGTRFHSAFLILPSLSRHGQFTPAFPAGRFFEETGLTAWKILHRHRRQLAGGGLSARCFSK